MAKKSDLIPNNSCVFRNSVTGNQGGDEFIQTSIKGTIISRNFSH